jgi:hypothetical protein
MATSGQGVLRRLLVVFEFGTDLSGVEKGKAKLGNLLNDMKKVAAAFAGGMIAKGIASFVKDTVDEMMGIRKGAQELKITTDEMQQLQSAARATGMDVKWLHFTLERLEVNVERAGHGAKRQAEAMALLGLKSHDASGKVKNAKELFLDFAGGFEKIKNQNTQARAVWDLMGRGAHRLLPLLRMGRERIEELMRATEEYGKYQKEDIERAAEYTIVLEHLRLVFTGIKSFIMSQWLPILQKQTEGLIKAGKWMMTMMKNSLLAKAALQMLQVAIAGMAIKMALAFPWATALIAAFTALTLLWDDILVMFAGGHSLIGDTLDKLFGKGSSTKTVEYLRNLWSDIATFVSYAWRDMKKLLGIDDNVDTRAHVGVSSPGELAMQDADDQAKVDKQLADWEARGGRQHNANVSGRGPITGSPIQWEDADPNSWSARLFRTLGATNPAIVGRDPQWQGPPMPPVQLNVTVPTLPGTDAKEHGHIIGKAAGEELQRHIKAAAASLRREKQTAGE